MKLASVLGGDLGPRSNLSPANRLPPKNRPRRVRLTGTLACGLRRVCRRGSFFRRCRFVGSAPALASGCRFAAGCSPGGLRQSAGEPPSDKVFDLHRCQRCCYRPSGFRPSLELLSDQFSRRLGLRLDRKWPGLGPGGFGVKDAPLGQTLASNPTPLRGFLELKQNGTDYERSPLAVSAEYPKPRAWDF